MAAASRIVLALALLALTLGGSLALSPADGATDDPARAVFQVVCYDVGKAALEGRAGVEKVISGWRGNREVNTVWYDPGITDVHALERILRGVGTYLGTLEPDER